MATHIREQQAIKLPVRKRITFRRLIVAILILLFALLGTLFGFAHSQEHWANIPVPVIVSIAFVVINIIFVMLQLYYPRSFYVRAVRHPRLRLPKSLLPLPGSAEPSRLRKSIHSNMDVSPGLPSTNPRTVLQRQSEVEDLYTTLIKQDVTAIVLAGMAGVGKSTLAAMFYEYAEEQRAAGKGPFIGEALWIKINTGDTLIDLGKALFAAIKMPLPNFESFTSNQLAEKLFDALSITKRLVVLDQFDNVLDAQTGQIPINQSLSSELSNRLNRRQITSRILFTSRFWPSRFFEAPMIYIREHRVKGLGNSEGLALLQKLGINGTEEEIYSVVMRCQGHPFGLRLLGTFLSDYHLSIGSFVRDPIFTKLWLEDVAQNILGHSFMEELSQVQRELLAAFSMYREPMPLGAVEALKLNAELSKVELQSALDTLLAQDLVSEEGKSRYESDQSAYRLHTIVAHYIPKHYQSDQHNLRSMHANAAQYYLEKIPGSCPPKGQRQHMNDVRPLIEASWQLSQAEKYHEAFELMERELIFFDLKHWRELTTLLDLYQMLLPLGKWHPASLQEVSIYKKLGNIYNELGQKKEAKKYFEHVLHIVKDEIERGKILNDLGSVYSVLGKKEEAKGYLKQALHIVREVGDSNEEGSILNNLGLVYDDLGQKENARELLDQALRKSRETGDRLVEGRALNNLGLVYFDMGQKDQARGYYELALKICRETGDQAGEVLTLRNLGQAYDELGQRKEAVSHLEEALRLSRELKDHWEEGRTLNYMGRVYADSRQYTEALRYYKQALTILEEVGDSWGESKVLSNMSLLYIELGKKEDAKKYFERALLTSREAGDLRGEGRILSYSHRLHDNHEQRREHLERALRLNREVNDRRGEGSTLHNLGQIFHEQGLKKAAHEFYASALHVHREVGDRRKVGLTLHHVGMLYFEQRHYEAALAALLLAKMILEEVQSPDYEIEKVQKWIDTLSSSIGKQHFEKLLEQVEYRAHEIVEKALSAEL